MIGIVASRIAERHHRPAILIALDGEEGSGSGRSIRAFDLLGGLHAERRAPAPLRRPQGRGGPDDRAARRSTPSARRSSSTPPRCSRPRTSCPRSGSTPSPRATRCRWTSPRSCSTLAPFGMGNPAVSLLVPAATMSDPQAARRGPPRRVHAQRRRRALALRGLRRRRLAAGRRRRARRRRRAAGDRPLERLGVAAAGPARGARVRRPGRSSVLGEPECFADGLLGELDRDLERPVRRAPRARGRCATCAAPGSPACSATSSPRGEPVLAVTAHAPHRAARARAPRRRLRAHLLGRAGGRSGPRRGRSRTSSSSTRPPRPLLAHPSGEGWTHLAWGTPELDFAVRIHEWDFNLREPLTAVYRALRAVRAARGEAGETLLRGDGPQPRSAALAGRLVRVLTELGLVDLERGGPGPRGGRAPAAHRARALRRLHGLPATVRGRTAIPDQQQSEASKRPERRRRRRRPVALTPTVDAGRGRRASPGRPRRARRRRHAGDPGRPDDARARAARRPVRDRLRARRRGRRPDRPPARSCAPSCSPASTTPTSAASRARTSSPTRSAWPRSAPACAWTRRRCAPRCCTTRSRTRRRASTRSREEFGEEVAGARRRRDQADRDHVPVARRGAGRELPQDDGRDGHGHPGHPDQARRPPAQHAHARRDAQAEADREGQGDPRDLRAARAPARHPRDQVGARGPRLRDAAPAQVPGDQGPGQPAARGARALRGQGRRLPGQGARGARHPLARSQAAPSTSTRSTRR